MKSYILYLLYLLIFSSIFYNSNVSAQNYDPVSWSYSVKKLGEKKYEITLKADIQENWHLYALDPGEGPIPTTVVIKNNPIIKSVQTPFVEKGKKITKYDNNFGATLSYFKNSLTLQSNVLLKINSITKLQGSVKYMVCDDSKCLPPTTKKFVLKLE